MTDALLRFVFGPLLEILRRIEKGVLQIIELLQKPQPAPDSLVIAFGPVSLRSVPQGDSLMLRLTDEQKATATIRPKTAAGNPATIDGTPAWSVSNPDVLDLVVSEDGMTATITAKGPLGTSQVSVTADADLGDGVRALTGTDDVEVVAAEAATIGIEFGTPELK